MLCPTCKQEMVPCEMNPEHSMCLQCSDLMAKALKICRPCLDEYDESVRAHVIDLMRDPEKAKNTTHWW